MGFEILLTDVVLILIIHWIADFVCQSESWSINKSKDWRVLVKHTLTYSLIWLIPLCLYTGDWVGTLYFVLITFVLHSLVDYHTSKAVKKRFEDKHYGSPIPNFGAFTLIGLDQLFHYLQLFGTWHIVFFLNL